MPIKFFKDIPKSYYYLFLIVLISFIAKLIYVFYFSDYKNYLVSDMGGYWARATNKFYGDTFSMNQWTAWSPSYHFYLFGILKILYFLNLSNYGLEVVLFLNILYSAISIFCFYFIAEHLFKNSFQSLITTACYAISYPITYLNIFVLSENISIPIVIMSVYLLLTYYEKKHMLFITGLFLGIAVIIRPALGLIGISFFLYILLVNKPSFYSTIRGFIFLAGYFIVIFLALVEITYISKGELKSLAGNGGVNFFISQCKPSIVKSENERGSVHVGSPNYYGDPNCKEFLTDHPIHDQKYFYKLGLECIKNNPNYWVENFINLKAFFTGPLFPSLLSARGFTFLMPFSNYLLLFMSLTLGLLFWVKRDLNNDENKKIFFLLSIPALTVFVSYFYIPEQRYLFPVYFVIYLLFFLVFFNIEKHMKTAMIYSITIIVINLSYISYIWIKHLL